MKELKTSLTLLVNGDEVRLEIRDEGASITFLTTIISPEDFCRLLSRQANVKTISQIRGIDKIGKKMEHKPFEFKLPDGFQRAYKDNGEQDILLKSLADSQLKEGWEADRYFGSQGSFFEKDGEKWARVTIRRYI